MTAKVICFASAKGGSGKTVTTASIGAFLVAIGKKVLLIDTDASTNGLTLLYLKEVLARSIVATKEKPLKGLYEVLSTNEAPEVVILPSGVHLLPATYRFQNTDDSGIEEYSESLRQALLVTRDSYDYILLDAQAGSDIFAQRAMSRDTSDLVALVAEYDPLSAAGIERLKGLMREDLTYVRTWILLNKVLPEFAKNFSDFLEVARYLSPIPWDAEVVRAYARRRLALDIENGNAYTLAIMQTVGTLFGDELGKDIEVWKSSRADAIRRPLNEQYEDLEKELAGIILDIEKIEFARGRLELMWATTLALGLVGSLFLSFNSSTAYHWSVIAAVVVGLTLGLFVLYNQRKSTRTLDAEIEKSKVQRRRRVLEQQLERLESFRVADFNTLVDTKPRQPGA
jgi:cellulose biosynthesis protein BcsQ